MSAILAGRLLKPHGRSQFWGAEQVDGPLIVAAVLGEAGRAAALGQPEREAYYGPTQREARCRRLR
jgi:hypothetical protein